MTPVRTARAAVPALRRLASRPCVGAALLALLATAAGCSIARGLQTPNRGPAADAGADTATADTASADAARPDSAPAAAVPGDTARAPAATPADSLLPDGYPTAAELEEMGPTYTPYAVGPQLLPGEWLTDLLSDTLAPVVDRHEPLSVQDYALYWVLVDRHGDVRDAVLHTSSESEAFDRAARVVAERLRYRPAVAEGQPVPVWVLTRISLLMR